MSLTLFPTAGVTNADPPIGDFTEGLDPRAQLLPNYPHAPPDLYALLQHLMGPAQGFKPTIQPPIGDYNEALRPQGQLLPNYPNAPPDPAAMSPTPMGPSQGFQGPPQPPMATAGVPMLTPRPSVPFAAAGQGKGALMPYAAPGVGGKGAPMLQHIVHHLMRGGR